MPKTKDNAGIGTFRGLIELIGSKAAHGANDPDAVMIPTEIEVLQTGEWDTPFHGSFKVTREDLIAYERHFKERVRKDLPIDFEHDTIGGAAGWIVDVYIAPASDGSGRDALWAKVDWTEKGSDAMKDRQYRFFSPEFADKNYQDPETGEFFDNVLIGGGLTNRPLFKDLRPVVANEGGKKADQKKDFTKRAGTTTIYLSKEVLMELADIVEKNVADLSDEEKAFLNEHKDDLTDEQKEKFADAIKAEGGEGEGGEGDKGENGGNGEGGGEGAGDGSGAGEGGEGETQAAENKDDISIKASELEQLKADAKLGREANEELRNMRATEKVNGLCFNEKAGLKFPVTMKEAVTKFFLGLSDAQQKQFSEIAEKMPRMLMFGEAGADESATGSAIEEVKEKADKALKASEKDGKPTMSYGAAMKKVLSDNKELAARYKDERGE